MAKYNVVMPAMGEGIIEVTITRWFISEGDWIEEDTPLLEVATDKVDSEVPTPVSGKVVRLIHSEGDIAQIGEVLAIIESEQKEEESSIVELPVKRPEVADVKKKSHNTRKPRNEARAATDMHITPFVRFLAKERGVTLDELRELVDSAGKMHLTKHDINEYVISGRPFKSKLGNAALPNTQEPNNHDTQYQPEAGEELVEMDRTRQLIAEHMVRSKRISPHVTSFVEVDVTGLVQWRAANKVGFERTHGVKLTYTPLIIDAVVKAIKDYPGINISVAGNSIVKKSNINIGVATALPNGNLIVPVIKHADHANLSSLAMRLDDLVSRARAGNLEPHDIKGGTFTITNMGQYNNVTGIPIINQPEVAILAVGSIRKKPGVVYVNDEPTVGIRDMVTLALSYDHRVVDGALGGAFLNAIGQYLELRRPDY